MWCRPGPGPQEATPILVEGRAALQAKPSLERRPMKLERRAVSTAPAHPESLSVGLSLPQGCGPRTLGPGQRGPLPWTQGHSLH